MEPDRRRDRLVFELSELCDRIDRDDREILAFVDEPDRRGRVAAEASALVAGGAGSPRPALFGLPIGVKDIVNVDGLVTAAGTSVPASCFAGPQARLATRLRHAGAVVVGKTTTTEFAFTAPAPTRNPRDPARTPGGSSSGSAAAVAAGFVPLAVGTQTVDSVITPAAYCGVVGFKASFGRIPLDGVVPFSPSMDCGGLIGADVGVVAAGAAVVCDRWRVGAVRHEPALAVPSAGFLDRAGRATVDGFEGALDRLAAAGWRIVRTAALADIEAVARRHRRLNAAEFAAVHAGWFARHGHRYRPPTAALVAEGRALPRSVIEDGRASSGELRGRLARAMVGAGAWAAPATTGPAPLGLEAIGDPIMSVPWTHAHLPMVTVPLPAGADEPPTGLLLAGRLGGDEALLALAAVVADLVS